MINFSNNIFNLSTEKTSYIFKIAENGLLVHLHYGRKIKEVGDGFALVDKNPFSLGNSISYDDKTVLENVCMEISSKGKGDTREAFVDITYADGSSTNDFIYEKHELLKGKTTLNTLPSSYASEEEAETLVITLKEKHYGTTLELTYSVFEKTNVITRSSKIINTSDNFIRINRLLSTQVDFDDYNFNMIHFGGAWAREMEKYETPVNSRIVVSSNCGVSSNRSNPFVMLAKPDTTEDAGECYGFNLIYSGNHYEEAMVNGYGQTRFISGINPDGFTFLLEKNEVFEAPEAVMTYSYEGFSVQSRNMHNFINNHIVRGDWAKKERPILLNSWEAAYFDIDESKLLKMAKAAKETGIELFVMDDGWFGKRDNEKCSLGDWKVNTKKLPNGIEGLARKINDIGLDFGIWVEPEMISEDSDLYREHPDYAMQIPGREQAVGRYQMILDLTRADVREYVVNAMSDVFSSGNISYVKWDMNRIFSDVYSSALPADRQQEVSHRYVMGLYEIMKTLTEKYPNILFEGCASGGNRFDLGILCYMPQIWASDDTDAVERIRIQTNYSYGYPMSTISAHVSGCPNHQTLRVTPIETRFNVAAFGVLGYECNLLELKDEEKKAVAEQVEYYKKYRRTLQFGDFYRIINNANDPYKKGVNQWITVSKDKKEAILFYYQDRAIPNYGDGRVRAKGLSDDKTYHFSNREFKYDVRLFGDLINTVAPFHIKKDSFVHNTVAKFVKMNGEKEDYIVSGELLNNAGIKLHPKYAGTGYNDDVAYFQDYCSRVYAIQEE